MTKNLSSLLEEREKLRKKNLFGKADRIREKVEKEGYRLSDTKKGPKIEKVTSKFKKKVGNYIVLFGSGEISPVGRRIHEFVFKKLVPPVNVVIIDTPAGFQPNVNIVALEIKDFIEKHLKNFKPQVTILNARDKEGKYSVNRENICKELKEADYIFTGPGSPTYALNLFKDSRLYYCLKEKISDTVLSFASAATIALGRYTLPVYEIYKVGTYLYWEKGLDFFSSLGLPISIVPHWNNNEGGKKLDTSRCFMGLRRFEKLLGLLPKEEILVGIDEQTALVINLNSKKGLVLGKGKVTILKDRKVTLEIASGNHFDWSSIPI